MNCVLAPGAIILSVTRDPPWLCIVTDRGTFYCAGSRIAMELECPACGEFRLVEIIETAKQQVGFCKICGRAFPLKPLIEPNGPRLDGRSQP